MIIGGIKVQKLSYNDTQHFFRGCRIQGYSVASQNRATIIQPTTHL